MPFVIGTAGHIDHGKTSLIKALTGQDTDRLAEEKRRGISIDLGFAHLDLPDGTRAGIIDVPGHERFIRNMLAGAHGIDLVLLTVAADDGVMPQTVEHLDILHLLGVRHAIVVMTKIDLATPERIAEVTDEVHVLVSGTSIDGAPIVGVSSATGAGLETLRLEIARALARIDVQPRGGYFRLPVDRAFLLQGHGVVVTGTALQGEVATGDRLRCLPGDQVFRVRQVEVHGASVPAGTRGQRIALNLAGSEAPLVERGHVLGDERLTRATDRFDASLEIRPNATDIKNHQRVRVHLGTAERLGKLILLGSHDEAMPGRSAFCQVVLTEPCAAVRGDRFIIRDETARQTLGGGVVLHPWARPHARREPGLDGRLETLRVGDEAAVARLYLDEQEAFALSVAPLREFLNLRTEETVATLRSAGGVRTIALDGEDVYTTERKWNDLTDALLAALAAFHARHPLSAGQDMEELRDQLASTSTPRLFRAFVAALESERLVVRDGSAVRLPQHTVTFTDEERRVAAQVTELLGAAPLSPPTIPEMARTTGIERGRLVPVLRVLERSRSVVRISDDLYLLRASLDHVIHTLRDEFPEGHEITPAMFRDRFATTRKYAIPLLEYLDVEGVTSRVGEVRRLRAARTSHNPAV